MDTPTCYRCDRPAMTTDGIWYGAHCEEHNAQANEEAAQAASEDLETDECPNCEGIIAINGDRYESESPRALICLDCELVYA